MDESVVVGVVVVDAVGQRPVRHRREDGVAFFAEPDNGAPLRPAQIFEEADDVPHSLAGPASRDHDPDGVQYRHLRCEHGLLGKVIEGRG